MVKTFGRRGENALKALEEGAVKKYIFEPSGRVVWVVVGKEKDYQVIPSVNYCSCEDFYYRVLNGETALCYHIIAQKISEIAGKFEVITDVDELYEVFMEEWRLIKKKDFPKENLKI